MTVYRLMACWAVVFCLTGCANFFSLSRVSGDHWKIVPGKEDPTLTAETVTNISHILSDRLHLTLCSIGPESHGWSGPKVSSARLMESRRAGIVFADIAVYWSGEGYGIYFDSLYSEGMWKAPPIEIETNIEHDLSQRVLPVLKELYPHSAVTPYVQYDAF